MLCSILHCQKGFKLKPLFYKICARSLSALPSLWVVRVNESNGNPKVMSPDNPHHLHLTAHDMRRYGIHETGEQVDCCIIQLKAQGPFGTCNESKEEEGEQVSVNGKNIEALAAGTAIAPSVFSLLLSSLELSDTQSL